jgi:Flp pilus assembly protein TadG
MEWAILTPVLLLVILLTVQFAMVYHARHVALAMAETGARSARTDRSAGWITTARDRAHAAYLQLGSNLFNGEPTIQPLSTNGDNNRYVEVTATAVQVVPWLSFPVHVRVGGPVECFRPDVPQGGGLNCK